MNKKLIWYGSVFLIAGIIYLFVSFLFQNKFVSRTFAWLDICISTLIILYGIFEEKLIKKINV